MTEMVSLATWIAMTGIIRSSPEPMRSAMVWITIAMLTQMMDLTVMEMTQIN